MATVPAVAQRVVDPRTGIITPPWQQFLASLVTGAVADTNLGFANVMTFGALGNGSADDTAAIVAAIASGLPVYFPPGTYICTAQIVVGAANGLVIVGAGSVNTTLRFTTTASAGLSFTYADVTRPPSISGLTLEVVGNSAATAIALAGPVALTTYIEGPKLTDLVIRPANVITDTWATGVSMSQVWYPNINNVTIKGGITFIEPYTMSMGFHLTNVQAPFARNVYLQHIITGVMEDGTSLGEGFNWSAFEMVGVNVGFNLGSMVASPIPAEFIGNGHISASFRGIIAANRVQTVFSGLVLYKTPTTLLNWIGILGSEMFSCMFDNIFFGGSNQAGTGNGDGITLTGASAGNVISNLTSDYFTAAGFLVAVENTSTANSIRSNTFEPLATGGAPVVALSLVTNTGTGLSNRIRPLNTQGSNVASTNNLALPYDGDTFHVTGATQINLLSTQDWNAGLIAVLYFDSTPTVKHNQVASGNFQPIMLAGSVDFVATANSRLTLQSFSGSWWEIARTRP